MSSLAEQGNTRSRRKRVVIGSLVSNLFGPFIEISVESRAAADPSKRLQHGWQCLFGFITAVVGPHRYRVEFDNGLTRECASNTLVIETATAALPPNLFTIQPGNQPGN